MKKKSVCVLFGGAGQDGEKSLRSAEFILSCLDPEKYNLFPVGITADGDWVLFRGDDYSQILSGQWVHHPDNRRAALSPVRGQGLLSFEGDCVVREWIDVAFPVLEGEDNQNCCVQGLLKLAGIPYVGSAAASVVAMDRSLTKLAAERIGIKQVQWGAVRSAELEKHPDSVMNALEEQFGYPMVVKPADLFAFGGAVRASERSELKDALLQAASGSRKVLVEAFIPGEQLQVAVIGHESPVASECGLIDVDEDIQVAQELQELARDVAVRIYTAMDCRGMACVSFLVDRNAGEPVFNVLDPLPELSKDAVLPQLFAASGISEGQLIDSLLQMAMEEQK